MSKPVREPRYSRRVKSKSSDPNFDWDIKLVRYIREKRNQPFSWGDNDCLTFADGAVKAMTGAGFTDGHLGGYKTAKGATGAFKRWQNKTGFSDIIEGIDAKFERVIGLPPRGSVVAMPTPDGAVFPYSIGVMASHLAAFVSEDGLIMVVPTKDFIAWRVR